MKLKDCQSYPIFYVDFWNKNYLGNVLVLKVWKGKCSLVKGVSKQPLQLFIFLFPRGKHPKNDRKGLWTLVISPDIIAPDVIYTDNQMRDD